MKNDAAYYLTQKDKQSLEFLLNHKEGRWFLMRLFDRCHVLHNEPAPKDDILIFEGEKRAVFQIVQGIEFLGKDGLTQKHLAEDEYYLELKRIYEMGKGDKDNEGF